MFAATYCYCQETDNLLETIRLNGSELLLEHRENECGRNTGDIEKLRIYQYDYFGPTYADYMRTEMSCESGVGLNRRLGEITRKKIVLSQEDKKLTAECVAELSRLRLNSQIYIKAPEAKWTIPYNSAILSDSTLVIVDSKSKDWECFRKLVERIIK